METENICKEDSGNTATAEENKTPVRPPRASKRKCVSPVTPVTPQGRLTPDGDLVLPSAKRRRKSASSMPHSPLLKPPLTERQQMALLMQMTDPQKQAPLSGGEESMSTTPKSEPSLTPRSRLQKRNDRGETLLHTACIRGDVKLVTSLIDQGADINTTDNAGWTSLHEACNHGHIKVVSQLLKHRADVNARGMDGDTPLHDAAINGHLETVQLLLKYGSDPYQMNDKELNPIESCKNPDIVSLMREWPQHRGIQDDSEDEDVFAVSKETRPQSRTSQLRRGSKGSSRSSAGDDSDSGVMKGSILYGNARGRHKEAIASDLSRRAGHTPTSRPRSVLYSDLSSSASEDEAEKLKKTPKLRGRKGKYNLAMMAETKQKLLGKLDKSSEADERMKKEEESRKRNRDNGTKEAEERGEDKVEVKESVDKEDKEDKEEIEEGEVVDSEEEGEGEEEGMEEGEVREGLESREEESPVASHDEADTVGEPEHTSPAGKEDSPGKADIEDGGPSLCPPPAPSPDETPPTATSPPPSPNSPEEPSMAERDQQSAERELSSEMLNESQGVESGSPNSPVSCADEEQEEKNEDEPSQEGSPPKLVTSPKASELEEENRKEDYQSSSESDQEANAMEVEPQEALSTSHTSSASNGTPDQDLLVLPSPPPDPTQSTAKRSKERDAMKANQSSSSEDSEIVIDRVLRSAVKKSNGASTASAAVGKDKVRESLLVSWSLKMLNRPVRSEEGSMSYSLSQLDMEASRAPSSSRYLGDRQDSISSSYDSSHSGSSGREAVGIDHVLAKHRAMAQPQTPLSRRIAEEKEGKTRRDSLSVSFDWSSLPSSQESTQSAPCSTVASPLTLGAHQDSMNEEDDDDEGEEKERKEGQPASTLVSLPLAFSDATENPDSSLLGFPSQTGMREESDDGEGAESLTSTPGPSHHRARGPPPGSDSSKLVAGVRATPTKRDRGVGSCQHQDRRDLSSLPPKRRYRPVIKSAVIQQRQKMNSSSIPWPAHLSSFLMCTREYSSNHKLQPSDPKLVYPPLVPSLYKVFSEQEAERVQLAMAHRTQQDRIVLSMEQEVLRAHQRATRDYVPISVCSVLLENLQNQGLTWTGLPEGCGPYDAYHLSDHNVGMSSPPHEGEESVDIRLLSGLVQDVWDKFQELYFSLQARQRHEVDTLWAVQHSQWMQKIKELGLTPVLSHDLPNPHIPLATASTI